MNNSLNIKIGDRIKGFFASGDFIVRGFFIIDTKELSLLNPVTMNKFEKEGSFWAVSLYSCPENFFSTSHAVPLDMIKQEYL